MSESKTALRHRLRQLRREHVTALPPATRALLFLRPPQAIAALVPPGAVIGVYAQTDDEAPANRYASWFFEHGHPVALPWFAARGEAMTYRQWTPGAPDTLERGPYGIRQPAADAAQLAPDVVFVPLLGFTADGARLGQGAGHYDRWLEAHPQALAIGLAWDCQLVERLPVEPHDQPLAAVVTPARLYGDPAR